LFRPIFLTLIAAFMLLSLAAAAAPSGAFQVRIAANLSQKAAQDLQRDLQVDGFSPVAVVDAGGGKYEVHVGAASTEAQAKGLVQGLKEGGYSPLGIVSPKEKATQKTVSTAEAGKVFRVLLQEFPNKDLADDMRKAITADGYPGVEVVPEGEKFRVYIGSFATPDQGELMVAELKRDGYPARVVSTFDTAGGLDRATAASMAPENVEIPAAVRGKLSAEDERQYREVASGFQRAELQAMTADEMIQIRRKQQELERKVGTLANAMGQVSRSEQQRTDAEKQVKALYVAFSQALGQQNWHEAEATLAKIAEINPAEPSLDFKRDVLNRMRGNQPTMVSAAREQENQASVQAALAAASAAMQRKDVATAKTKYYEVLGIDPNNAEAKKQLDEISRIDPASARTSSPMTAGMTDHQKYLLYGGIGAVVLVLGILAFVLFQNTRRERELIHQVQELAAHSSGATAALPPAPEPFALPPPTPAATSSDRKKKRKGAPEPAPLFAGPTVIDSLPPSSESEEEEVAEAEPEQEEHEPIVEQVGEHRLETRPPGEADLLILSGLDEGHGTETLPEPPAEEVPSGNLDFVSFEDLNIPLPSDVNEPAPTAATASIPTPPGMPEIDLEALLNAGSSFAEAPAPPAEPAAPEMPEPASTARIQDITPRPAPIPELPPQVAPPPAPESPEPAVASIGGFDATVHIPAPEITEPVVAEAAADAPAAQNGAFFMQDFEDAAPGMQPEGWRGEYEYASLTVDDQAPANGSKHCLKFEKRSGAGSANYVCQFPNASGRVVVEFDMRCDDKNKYLLGFYIEKDEDFKQSVHTIIHRTDSKTQPSLRIQGEPIPYQLGSWRHMKYDLNLMMGVVNAYVDGQQIVRDGKLPTNPPYVNTLSIRDNLATTGVLYLDNIKIYKA
jgi:tetratricopeptide (TPR) repeat protein